LQAGSQTRRRTPECQIRSDSGDPKKEWAAANAVQPPVRWGEIKSNRMRLNLTRKQWHDSPVGKLISIRSRAFDARFPVPPRF